MKRPFAIALLITALAASGASAQNGDVPVTSAIADADTAIASSLQIRSDGGGSYVHRPRYLSSVIQSVGDWELDLGIYTRLSGRKVYLEFSQPIAGTGPGGGEPAAPPSQQYVGRLISKCWSYSTNMFLIPAGQQVTCPTIVRFNDYNGNQYRIYMNRSTFADTDDVNVACLGSGTNGNCNRWTVTPAGTYAGADGLPLRASVGKLVKLVSKKGATTEVPQGNFSFSFSIGVAQ